eukprot:CAMPEP_0117050200 /NCGR_PEP_ID=MMETSP0472-20121206/34663_1 /TAXON_ID=693140 ORGANISM="Tiarina fusus, Strain LIS" /NCGR_SAMPLE_ID=MMETSP0472 /ASSEMBLY_ACC=CAM_ASM_000603 /LENGTH=162 /DNA_ID=CAMNT_0004763897 /DNA_START=97 /DNA_END=581 /DNA_ORIENTATION=+
MGPMHDFEGRHDMMNDGSFRSNSKYRDSTHRRALKLLNEQGFVDDREGPGVQNTTFAASQRNLRQFTHPAAASFVTGQNDSIPRPPVRRQPRRNSIGTAGDYERRRDVEFPMDANSEHTMQRSVFVPVDDLDQSERSCPPAHYFHHPPGGYGGGYGMPPPPP